MSDVYEAVIDLDGHKGMSVSWTEPHDLDGRTCERIVTFSSRNMTQDDADALSLVGRQMRLHRPIRPDEVA